MVKFKGSWVTTPLLNKSSNPLFISPTVNALLVSSQDSWPILPKLTMTTKITLRLPTTPPVHQSCLK